MSSLSYFGQKKKKQALRRLSQSPSVSTTRSNKQERSKQSWPPRRRLREDADDFSPRKSESGLRETKRTRASRQSSGDSNSNSSTVFTSQRIVRSDDNKSLVISKSARDTSGSDSDVSRSLLAHSSKDPGHKLSSERSMAGQASGGSATTGSIFTRLQTGPSRQGEAGNTSSLESLTINPFATRVSASGPASFQFTVPVSTASAVPSVEVQFPEVSSGFGQSSFRSNKFQGTFGQSVFSSSSEPGQTKEFGNFTFTIKQTSAGSTSTSTTDASSTAGVLQGSTVGPQSSTIDTFTFRQPGRAKSIEADTSNVFGGPQGSKQGPSAKDSAAIFGIKPDIPKSESSAIHTFTFAKPKSDGFRPVQNVSPPKRPASTDYHHGDSYTKRPITKWTDAFSQDQDLADLETFGSDFSKPHQAEKESKQSVVKKSRLVSKAIEDAVSNKSRSERSKLGSMKEFRDRRSDGSRRDRESRDRKPDGSRRNEGRRERDEGSRRREAGDISKVQKSLSSGTAASSSTSSSTRRYSTPDEIQKLHSIVIKHVPDIVNSRPYLKKFFSEFGNVTKVNSMPSKAVAIIHFDNHDSAAIAKKKVRILKPNTKPVEIFWVQSESSSTKSGKRSSSENKSDKPSSKDSYLDRALAPMNRTSNVPADKPKTRPKDTGSTGSHNKQVAASAHEKMEKLEARDKIIRQEIKKRSKKSTYHALKGVCPDMCPERERYMREYQRRLSMYETSTAPDKVHHPYAVKEYSRSSADQEEPLPHELRPAPILMMTMNYLMNNIMDRGADGRWEDWFDFLWNRTRAIRKDITQQHLYGVTAVELMEKCARFHIFCAHRLCEQDRAIFDPKINNENLTKCLQSLKQFYQDLANEGVFCPSEAEFRAYDILLNLNEGDTLRQVQQYRPEVQGSEDVKFALKTFYALNSNNYIKFFKLVRSATYLNACIMHRYFTQMRNRAVLIMSYTYMQTTHYPLDDLVRLLAFEGEPEVTGFCMAHGLTVNDGTVHFSRSSFVRSESAIDAVRSVSIIETKNNKSVGEVVNGAPLPSNYIHEPSSSFTESGQYKGDITSSSKSVELPTQKAAEILEPTCSAAPAEDAGAVAPPPLKKKEEPRRVQYSNAAVKDVAKDMFIEVINEMSRELSENFLQWVRFVQMGSFELVNRIVGESIGDLSQEVVLETMREEQGRMMEERRAEQRMEQERQQAALAARRERQVLEMERLRQESIDRVSAEAVESIVQEILTQESNNVAIAQYKGVQMQLRQESIARCTHDISSDILQQSLVEECYQVADEVIQVAARQRDEKLAELEKCVLMSRTARYLQKWQRVYTLRVRLKRSQLTFPAAPPNQSLADQLQALWPLKDRQHADGQHDSTSMVTLESPFSVISSRETVAKTILRRHYVTCLRKQKAWAPFDLPEMLHGILDRSQHATHSQHGHLYWKLVMSLPDAGPQMSHDVKEGLDWLQAKLRRGRLQERFCKDVLHDSDKVQTLSLYTAEVQAQQGCHYLPMRLCTKVTRGHVSDYELGSNQLLGTSAVLFGLEDLNEVDWSVAYQRLFSLLEAKPIDPATPLLIVMMNDRSSSIDVHTLCEDRLRLRDLQHDGLLSVYHTITLAADIEDPSASEKLSEGIQWLAEHRPHSPHLSEDSLRGYIDTGLMELFSLPLHEDSKLRRNAGLPEQDVQNVVALYNAVISHLGSVASSVNLLNLSWPMAEFARTLKQLELPRPSWNLPKTLRLLNNRILGLQLPRVPYLHQDCDWRAVCESIQNYICEQLPGSDVDKAPLISRVQWLLDRSRRSFQNICYLTYDTPGCEPTARHIPWTHILEACITHMVSLVSAEDDNYPDDDPVTVYYFVSEFNSFVPPQEWKQATTTTREDTFTQLDSLGRSVLDTVLQKQTELSDKHSSKNLFQEESVPKVILEDEAPSVVAAKDTAEHLKTMMHKEKEETHRYEELLSSWLNDSTPQEDSQRSVESTDIGAPLTVQISQWHDGKPTLLFPNEGAFAREEKKAVSEGDATLSERFEKLKQQIAIEKQADELQEFRLMQMLGI